MGRQPWRLAVKRGLRYTDTHVHSSLRRAESNQRERESIPRGFIKRGEKRRATRNRSNNAPLPAAAHRLGAANEEAINRAHSTSGIIAVHRGRSTVHADDTGMREKPIPRVQSACPRRIRLCLVCRWMPAKSEEQLIEIYCYLNRTAKSHKVIC